MVAERVPEPRHPTPVTNLAPARHRRRQRTRLRALLTALIEARRAERQWLVEEIREVQAEVEREMPARTAYWRQFA